MNRPSTTVLSTSAATMGATSSFEELSRLLGSLSKGWGYGG